MEVPPWRLALVVVMQYMEGLTDRQAADAVRRCIDWKYALSLDLHDPGFDFTLLHDFRQRLLAQAAAQRLLDTFFLMTCKVGVDQGAAAKDYREVLIWRRSVHCAATDIVLEAMHYALNQLSAAAPAWVQQHRSHWTGIPAMASGLIRCACRRTPASARRSRGKSVQMGYQLLEWVQTADTLPHLPGTTRRSKCSRQIWLQQYYRCTLPEHETLPLSVRKMNKRLRQYASPRPTTSTPATARNARPIGSATSST